MWIAVGDSLAYGEYDELDNGFGLYIGNPSKYFFLNDMSYFDVMT